jgi:prepilin-type N-terminal cleavage/methylation domain-containing protein
MTKRTKGLSLTEMLVVLAILGILLTIAGFLLNGVIQRQRLNEATRTFGETLRRVSETAVTKSQRVTATVTSSSISWSDESGVSGNASLPHNATIAGAATTTLPATIVFTGRGLPVDFHRFTVSLKSQNRRVNLLTTGAVTYP